MFSRYIIESNVSPLEALSDCRKEKRKRKEKSYRCVGVQMTTHVLDLQFQLVLRPSFRPLPNHPSKREQQKLSPLQKNNPSSSIVPYLESQMLQKVCSPVRRIRLRPASGIDKDTDGCRLHVRRVLGRNLYPSSSSISPPVVTLPRSLQHGEVKYTHSQSIGQGCRLCDDAGRQDLLGGL